MAHSSHSLGSRATTGSQTEDVYPLLLLNEHRTRNGPLADRSDPSQLPYTTREKHFHGGAYIERSVVAF